MVLGEIDTAEAVLRLIDAPGHLLRVAQQVHTRLWAETVPGDITAPQYAALRALAEQPGGDQRTIGDHAALDKATMAEMTVRLVQRGLLLRRRDPADGRRKLLSLSPHGATVLAAADEGVHRVHELLLQPLDAEERTTLLGALAAIATLAGAINPPSATQPVGYLIRVAQQGHTRLWTELVAADITSPQYAVLDSLAREPGIDQRTLGERAKLDKATMAELIGRLVRRGLVLRRRDPADGRRNLLTASPSGLDLLRSVAPGVRTAQERLLEPVPESTRGQAVELLRRVARMDGTEEAEASVESVAAALGEGLAR